MSQKTKIEWTDSTWNPVTGCTKVSAGCANCYAERITERWGKDFSRIVEHPERLKQPLSWQDPRRIFVNSMSDLFHQEVSDKFIEAVFMVMAACAPDSKVWCGRHTFQILTKRPERMRDFILNHRFPSGETLAENPLPNVWLGVSVENQRAANERIPILLEVPAEVRFLSCEPLLGPVMITGRWETNGEDAVHDGGIGWVICGGETGPHARPMHPDWARSLRDQSQAANIPFFFKQWGEWAPKEQWFMVPADQYKFTDDPQEMYRVGRIRAGRTLDDKVWDEFPGVKTNAS